MTRREHLVSRIEGLVANAFKTYEGPLYMDSYHGNTITLRHNLENASRTAQILGISKEFQNALQIELAKEVSVCE